MKTLCITMGPEWPLAEAEFKRVGLQVEPFRAIVEDNRVLAFNKSVYECMKLCKVEKKNGYYYEPLMLFEDDVMFDEFEVSFSVTENNATGSQNLRVEPKWEKWGDRLGEYVEDFMTLHLGANIIGSDTMRWQMPTNGTPKEIARLHNCWQSHATLYSGECVKYIIDNFKFVTDEYKTEGCQIFDEWLRTNVLNQGRSYVLNPMIAYQRPRFSEIWNRDADYTGAHRQGNNWMRENL